MNWITFGVFVWLQFTLFGYVESVFKMKCFSTRNAGNRTGRRPGRKAVKCYLQYEPFCSYCDDGIEKSLAPLSPINEVLQPHDLKYLGRPKRSVSLWRKENRKSTTTKRLRGGVAGRMKVKKNNIFRRRPSKLSSFRKDSRRRRNYFSSFVGPQGGDFDRRPIITQPFRVGIVDPRTVDDTSLRQNVETTDQNGLNVRTSSRTRVSNPFHGKVSSSASLIRNLNKEPAPKITHSYKKNIVDIKTSSRNTSVRKSSGHRSKSVQIVPNTDVNRNQVADNTERKSLPDITDKTVSEVKETKQVLGITEVSPMLKNAETKPVAVIMETKPVAGLMETKLEGQHGKIVFSSGQSKGVRKRGPLSLTEIIKTDNIKGGVPSNINRQKKKTVRRL